MVKAIFMVLVTVGYFILYSAFFREGWVNIDAHENYTVIKVLLAIVFGCLATITCNEVKKAWKDRAKIKAARASVSRSSTSWKDRGTKFLAKSKEYGSAFKTWATPHAKASGAAALTWSKGNPFLLMGVTAGFATFFLMHQGKALWMLAFASVAVFFFAKHAGKESELKALTKKAFSKELGWWLITLVLSGAAAFDGSTLGLAIFCVTVGVGIIRLARHFELGRESEICLIAVALIIAGFLLFAGNGIWGGLGFVLGLAGMFFGASAAFWYKTKKPLSADEKLAKLKKELDELEKQKLKTEREFEISKTKVIVEKLTAEIEKIKAQQQLIKEMREAGATSEAIDAALRVLYPQANKKKV